MKLNEIRIPELEARWRWPRAVSPFLTEVDRESLEWCASFNAFDPETQRLVHDKGKLSTFSVATSLDHGSTGANIGQTCSQACAMLACPKVRCLYWGDITWLLLTPPKMRYDGGAMSCTCSSCLTSIRTRPAQMRCGSRHASKSTPFADQQSPVQRGNG